MNLETLQAKTDRELDVMAAIHIFWGGIVNGLSESYVPTRDMACFIKLENALNPLEFTRYVEELLKIVGLTGEITQREVVVLMRSTPRQRTMAAILAKLGGG